MIKKIALLVVILFTVGNFAQSQSKPNQVYVLKGSVVDSVSNQSVSFCTVSASRVKMPMVYLKRVAADVNGNFSMEFSKPDTLLLKFESVGMKSTVKTVALSEKTTDLGKIVLPPNDKILSEVTVTAAKPLVKVDLDKITYDMKSDPESQSSNVLDMLRKVPLVTIDADENIQVKGKSNFKIFMNGKATNMITNNPAQVLKSIPANTIKSVEVITEPGAKYESEGLSGIINIITESAMKGYTASVNAGVDVYGSLNGGVYFTTKIGKWGITTNLNTSQFRSPESFSDYIRLNKTDNSTLKQNSSFNNKGNFRNGNFSVSYEMDSLDLLTFSGSGWGGNNTSNGEMDSKNDNPLQIYHQNRRTSNLWGGYEAGFDYQRSFKKPDKLLTLSYKLSYSPSGVENESWLDTLQSVHYSSPRQKIKTDSYGDEHTFQIDYNEPFNKKHVMEVGLKYIIRDNHSLNTYQIYDEQQKKWKGMSDIIDDDFTHRQDILGSYGSYTFKAKKFSTRVGVRFEHTQSSIKYKIQTDRNFTPPSFNNLVPSINFNYKMTDMSNITLSYTQRLSRPDIWYLNPFVDNSNPYNIQVGNPKLDTEISNSFNLSYGYFNSKFNLNSSVYYSFTNNAIEEINQLKGDTIISTYENIGINRSTGLSTYFRWQVTPKMNMFFNGNTSYNYLDDGKGTKNDGVNYNGNFGGGYNFPKDWALNLYTGVFKRGVTLQGGGGFFAYYGLNITKSYMQKKLNISLRPGMFLQKYIKFSSYTETETYRADNTYRRLAPNIRLNISYRFGKMKEQIKTAKNTIKNDDVKSGGSNNNSGGTGNL
ncbi:putative TonB-dependent receptor [uncultured Paludibacter sp.]|nr:putative TonB-dependent receptor [uncultured Paludibacter sp.]